MTHSTATSGAVRLRLRVSTFASFQSRAPSAIHGSQACAARPRPPCSRRSRSPSRPAHQHAVPHCPVGHPATDLGGELRPRHAGYDVHLGDGAQVLQHRAHALVLVVSTERHRQRHGPSLASDVWFAPTLAVFVRSGRPSLDALLLVSERPPAPRGLPPPSCRRSVPRCRIDGRCRWERRARYTRPGGWGGAPAGVRSMTPASSCVIVRSVMALPPVATSSSVFSW